MALVLPGSSTVVRSVGDVVHWSLSTAAFAVTLPTRLEALLFAVERLVARINQIADNVDRVVIGAAAVTVRAETLVEAVEQTSDIAGELLEIYEPIALQLAPLAARFADDLSEAEVSAAIKLIDQLPELTDRVAAVLPILGTLDSVSPEIHELLGVVKDLRQAIVGVPGFHFFRKRGEAKLD
ncbi:ribulose 1,5-bisphosphate carboxylase large subunit [Rhodococcus sp. IEGM 1409]|uniref:ribulose 1,5-bisphosphate carboxylase large subunit n=1 Tax=Rhodococcus sp. IEGM 1409 TaxID=3047082 RepID=UPI0024B6AC5B|nr:ribulose 1,5-bisphosphate carboxylase large subunit [Rhodococcus sp. IEGM 1409]MDI9901538.1 ribulose 1,5-bisphosphate carboxylase large subunit [Rhodococcus sp. IEGM 1409]